MKKEDIFKANDLLTQIEAQEERLLYLSGGRDVRVCLHFSGRGVVDVTSSSLISLVRSEASSELLRLIRELDNL